MPSVLDHRPVRSRQRHRLLAVAAIVALTVVTSACGSSGGDEKLEGLTRTAPMAVGSVSLPEVRPGRDDTPFRFRAEPGHMLFVTFGYTNCPDICPTTLSDLRKAREQIGSDASRVDAAFVTVDPNRDLPEIIYPYITSFVKGGHALRTGDPDALDTAQKAFGVTSSVTMAPDGSERVTHSARSFVVDPTGHVAVEWPFGVSADAMAHDLRILLDRS